MCASGSTQKTPWRRCYFVSFIKKRLAWTFKDCNHSSQAWKVRKSHPNSWLTDFNEDKSLVCDENCEHFTHTVVFNCVWLSDWMNAIHHIIRHVSLQLSAECEIVAVWIWNHVSTCSNSLLFLPSTPPNFRGIKDRLWWKVKQNQITDLVNFQNFSSWG